MAQIEQAVYFKKQALAQYGECSGFAKTENQLYCSDSRVSFLMGELFLQLIGSLRHEVGTAAVFGPTTDQ